MCFRQKNILNGIAITNHVGIANGLMANIPTRIALVLPALTEQHFKKRPYKEHEFYHEYTKFPLA